MNISSIVGPLFWLFFPTVNVEKMAPRTRSPSPSAWPWSAGRSAGATGRLRRPKRRQLRSCGSRVQWVAGSGYVFVFGGGWILRFKVRKVIHVISICLFDSCFLNSFDLCFLVASAGSVLDRTGVPGICSHAHAGQIRFDARVSCWPFRLAM